MGHKLIADTGVGLHEHGHLVRRYTAHFLDVCLVVLTNTYNFVGNDLGLLKRHPTHVGPSSFSPMARWSSMAL